ncbi:chemotaxis protein CheW [Solimonas marina]|uniref:Purine-binding chemotaxis protein CheW n=1 Tax=Solimonas marina TaxID=2714601 RepID=A0A969W7X4_9GAMM|nr:chemotaxis protein CheW [Solimonas marina]NKF22346.1 purine-binding chemotaxis protein CheW [Solimonas marina]
MSLDLRSLRDRPFELLEQLEASLSAARLDAPGAGGHQAQSWTGLGFRLGDRWLVAPREDVREVIAPPRATRVPNAQPWLTGLANVRGELLAIIDLPRYFELPPRDSTRGQRVLVLNSRRMPVGLLVDEIAGYRQFSAGDQRHELRGEAGPLSPFLLGAFVRDGQPWYAFSLHRLAQNESFRAAAA